MKLHLSMLTKSIMTGMAAALVAGTASAGSISGSPHDLSGETYTGADPANNVRGQICVVCHAPHNVPNASIGPLWNHEVPTGTTYTMYSSPLGTLDGGITNPMDPANGATGSFLCLSCHDGSIALDAFGGAAGSQYIPAAFRLGSDLSNDHPVGVEYTDATATTDGELATPSTDMVIIGTVGGDSKEDTVQNAMLEGGTTVQCTSCHDVHNKYTSGDKFLKVSKIGSAICLACHKK